PPVKGDANGLRLEAASRMCELPRVDVDLAAFRRVIATLRDRLHLAITEAIEFFEEVVVRDRAARLQHRVIRIHAGRKREPAYFELPDRLRVQLKRDDVEQNQQRDSPHPN